MGDGSNNGTGNHAGQPDGAKNGIRKALANLRTGRKNGNYSVLLELFAVVAVIIFFVSVRDSDGSHDFCPSTVVEAVVIDAGTAKYNGDNSNLKSTKYFLLFQYEYNGREYQKRLLYTSRPKAKIGDVCNLKISQINPEEILE